MKENRIFDENILNFFIPLYYRISCLFIHFFIFVPCIATEARSTSQG